MELIRECAETVYEVLGAGHSEVVYQNALCVALRKKGVWCDTEVVVPVSFMGHNVGFVRLDVVTEDYVLELKALATEVKDSATNQLRKYAGIRPNSAIINFGARGLQVICDV
jgi:GxxExxY protein